MNKWYIFAPSGEEENEWLFPAISDLVTSIGDAVDLDLFLVSRGTAPLRYVLDVPATHLTLPVAVKDGRIHPGILERDDCRALLEQVPAEASAVIQLLVFGWELAPLLQQFPTAHRRVLALAQWTSRQGQEKPTTDISPSFPDGVALAAPAHTVVALTAPVASLIEALFGERAVSLPLFAPPPSSGPVHWPPTFGFFNSPHPDNLDGVGRFFQHLAARPLPYGKQLSFELQAHAWEAAQPHLEVLEAKGVIIKQIITAPGDLGCEAVIECDVTWRWSEHRIGRALRQGVVGLISLPGDLGTEPLMLSPTGEIASLEAMVTDESAWRTMASRTCKAFEIPIGQIANRWRNLLMGETVPAQPPPFYLPQTVLDSMNGRFPEELEPLTLTVIQRWLLRPGDTQRAMQLIMGSLSEGCQTLAMELLTAVRNMALLSGHAPTIEERTRSLIQNQGVFQGTMEEAEIWGEHVDWIGTLDRAAPAPAKERPDPDEPLAKDGPFGSVLGHGLKNAASEVGWHGAKTEQWAEAGFSLGFSGETLPKGEHPGILLVGATVPRSVLTSLEVAWNGHRIDGRLEKYGQQWLFSAPLPRHESGISRWGLLRVRPLFDEKRRRPERQADRPFGLVLSELHFSSSEMEIPSLVTQGAVLHRVPLMTQIPLDGFHPPEPLGEGTTVRWMGRHGEVWLPPLPPFDGLSTDRLQLLIVLHGQAGGSHPPPWLNVQIGPDLRHALRRGEESGTWVTYTLDVTGSTHQLERGVRLGISTVGRHGQLGEEDRRLASFLVRDILILTTPAGGEEMTSLVIEADHSGFSGEGWHGLEQFQDRPVRWMSRYARCRLPGPWRLQPGQTVVVDGSLARSEGAITGLTVALNGHPLVQCAHTAGTGEAWQWSGVVPLLKEQLLDEVEITLQTEAVGPLSDTDSRVVGLLISRMALLPTVVVDASGTIPITREHHFPGARFFEEWSGLLRGMWIGTIAHLPLFVPEVPEALVIYGAGAMDRLCVEGMGINLNGRELACQTHLNDDGTWSGRVELPDDPGFKRGHSTLTLRPGGGAERELTLLLTHLTFQPATAGGQSCQTG